jgi:hypothetical protein
MKNAQLIIYHSTHSPWLMLRDGVLATACWILWGMVLLSIYRGDGFHFSSTYLMLVLLLSMAFLLWSGVHYLWSPIRLQKRRSTPLPLQKLALHFNLQSDTVQRLQHEKQVVLDLHSSGTLRKWETITW